MKNNDEKEDAFDSYSYKHLYNDPIYIFVQQVCNFTEIDSFLDILYGPLQFNIN